MTTKAKWKGGTLEFYDSATYERLLRTAAVQYYDDFLGAGIVVPAAGSAESGMDWVAGITGAAPPTVAMIADQPNGVMACSLTSASQAQTAALYMNDELCFGPTGLIFEARVKLATLPTLVAEIQFGMIGAYNAVPDTIAKSMLFDADGSGAINCATDDAVTDSGAISSAVTATAAQWKIYRIDATDVTDVKFYIDGARVASGTTFAYADTAAMQPYFGCYKASGAGLGVCQIDYVKCWSDRS